MRPPRLLFQSHNRRGLGHLMRGLNLARAICRREPEAVILFHARNGSARLFCEPEFRVVVRSDDCASTSWEASARGFEPDVVVYDTMLPADPDGEPLSDRTRCAYVMRQANPEKQAAMFASPFLDRVSLIVIPHTEAEFGYRLPPALERHSAFVGPIVRLPTPEGRARVHARYGIKPGDFVLTSTVGGGGFTDQAEGFFASVYAIHRRLRTTVAPLRHLVIRGPNFSRVLEFEPGVTLVDFEPDLVDLLALSDLVIAEGGYNTVNEIRAVGTPAVFLPSARNIDDQEARVRGLEARGLAAVCAESERGEAAERVAALCTSASWLQDVRRRYATHRLDVGNYRAAASILELARS